MCSLEWFFYLINLICVKQWDNNGGSKFKNLSQCQQFIDFQVRGGGEQKTLFRSFSLAHTTRGGNEHASFCQKHS